MKRILTLKVTIPSSSHNAPFSAELGSHWPAGTRFRMLSKAEQRYFQRSYGDAIFVEQVGGEEVILSVPTEKMAIWF